MIIETERLYLRRLTLEDKDELKKVLSNPVQMQHYPHPFSDEEVEQWIAWNIDNYSKYNHGLWAVILKNGNIFLGDCGVTIQNIDNKIVSEIGYHIIDTYCNKGYASEAALACKNYAFDVLSYTDIYSYAMESNKESQKVAKKIGLTFLKTYNDQQGSHIVYYEKRIHEEF